MAVSHEPNPTTFQKTMAMNDWYLGSDDWDYPLGGIQMLGKSDEAMIHAEAPRLAAKLSPDMPFEMLARHAVDFWLCGEDLPRPDNRVTLDKEGAVHLSIDESNNVEGVKRLRHKLDGMLGHLGMRQHHLLDHSLYLHKTHADRGHRPPGRHGALRDGPRLQRSRHQLPGARRGQPLRRGHQLLPEHRRGEPVAHRHGERVARRGPPARATRSEGPSVPRKVVIVGGGFGGLFAARGLRGSDVEVVLVDRTMHHLFQPLLYQVATGVLSEGQVAVPLRAIFSVTPT